MEGLLVGLGVGVIALGIVIIILSVISIIASIILLCLSVKEKGELKIRGIDETRIKKIFNLAVGSLIVSVISCSGFALLVLPVLAVVFVNSNAKTALQVGNVVEAAKKSDLALLMLVISNSVILGLSVLSTFSNIINALIPD